MTAAKARAANTSQTLECSSLKQAMGCFATGITVVTTHHDGADVAMTCNSFNTVSLEPPLVLWSIQKSSASHEAFTRGQGYSVSVLADSQRDLVMKFAKGSQEERFAGVALQRHKSGRATIEGAVAWFDCTLEQVIPAGDHDILIGRITDFDSTDDAPMIYVRGHFVDPV